MAPLKFLLVALSAVGMATAFTPVAQVRQQQVTSSPTQLQETFGLGLGEDTYENQPDLLKGEQEYKQYVNRINEENMLNRKYNVIRRVRELELLQATIDAGVLSKLEANGLDLVKLEELLPLLEQYGLLSLAANNQQLLVNGVAPLLVEGAPILLPVVAGALEVGPAAFFLAAATFAGLDAYLFANSVDIPLLGLPAGPVAGLLLIPLSVALGGVGVFLSGLKK
mmetsp:Transcript_60403/g.148210  ORF Transcript_60403/g.148210 Transcript_60403/m.148210 type:complete len:224 (-) Transcript_60403:165-836(-)